MEKGIISFSFDDGRLDNYYLIKDYCVNNGIPITLNATTAYIDNTIDIKNTPCNNKAMTIDNLIEISKIKNVEIALHGDNHKNEISDILSGKEKLFNWLNYNENKEIGFASPNSSIKYSFVYENKDIFKKNNIIYVRGSFNTQKYNKIKVLARKIIRIIPCKYLYNLAYGDSLMNSSDQIMIYSVPILHCTTISEIKYLINRCAKEKKWCIFMFHSIIKKNDEYYNNIVSFDYNKFTKLCEYIKNKKNIQLLNVKDALQLLKEPKNENKNN